MAKEHRWVPLDIEFVNKLFSSVNSVYAENAGATVTCGFEMQPQWAMGVVIDGDEFLFCPNPDFDHIPPKTNEEPKLAGVFTWIRQDEQDAERGFPYNKTVIGIFLKSDGNYYQREFKSRKKRDHWMKKIDEKYKNWPKI